MWAQMRSASCLVFLAVLIKFNCGLQTVCFDKYLWHFSIKNNLEHSYFWIPATCSWKLGTGTCFPLCLTTLCECLGDDDTSWCSFTRQIGFFFSVCFSFVLDIGFQLLSSLWLNLLYCVFCFITTACPEGGHEEQPSSCNVIYTTWIYLKPFL